MGPPVGWPLKFRISGPDPMKTRDLSHEFARVIGQFPDVQNINYDWNEFSKVVHVDVDQDRARQLGISSQQLSNSINAVLSGTTITQLLDHTYLIDIVGRALPDERATLDTLRSLNIATASGGSVPLSQIATLSYGLEPPKIWRRQREPTVTVQADTAPGVEAATVVRELQDAIAAFRAELPPGYAVAIGGTTEDSAKSQRSIFVVFPIMLLLMMTILMIQLQSFQRLAMVLLTAPLALIGVAGAMLLANSPMGFVAILGVISLIGMVILIAQIDHNIDAGQEHWEAVVDATQHRLRPILLTAAAAILAMIPIASTVFWGPMAYAIMGGLAVATVLTLVFLPTLYVTWFRISPPDGSPARSEAPQAAPA
jgi:multidrug efflux pump subunit AcrB